MPWCSDGLPEAELGSALEVTESAWADQCHEQGGTVVIPHFPQPNGEPATLIATGRADAVEMIVQQPSFHRGEEYYRYLNCGYRLPLVGGTDKMSSAMFPSGCTGRMRSLVTNRSRTTRGGGRWWPAGRSSAAGALVSLTIDGHHIGETLPISGPGTVTVEATASSALPIDTLEIVLNGRVVARSEGVGSRQLNITEDLAITEDSWIAARCLGPRHHDAWRRPVFAHTSPIYVACGNEEWSRFDPRVASYLLTLVEGSLSYVDKVPRYHSPGAVTHHHGEDSHRDYLRRPLLEAEAALRERIRSTS